jgi:hypothetical protein
MDLVVRNHVMRKDNHLSIQSLVQSLPLLRALAWLVPPKRAQVGHRRQAVESPHFSDPWSETWRELLASALH